MTSSTPTGEMEEVVARLTKHIRREIGPFAAPDMIVRVNALPKTRSGKIMRRLLRKVAHGERDVANFGDLSTLSEPDTVQHIIECKIGRSSCRERVCQSV